MLSFIRFIVILIAIGFSLVGDLMLLLVGLILWDNNIFKERDFITDYILDKYF